MFCKILFAEIQIQNVWIIKAQHVGFEAMELGRKISRQKKIGKVSMPL
jgi:hypothetical protein